MMFMGQVDKAQICLNQAHYITQKYNIKFEFDVNPEHYIIEEQVSEDTGEETAGENSLNSDEEILTKEQEETQNLPESEA